MTHLKPNRKLVCLQIVPSLGIGGIETGIRDLSKYLNNKNIENYILAETSLEINIKNLYLLDGLKFKNLFDQSKIKKFIFDLITLHKINVIHISSRAPAFYLIKWIKSQNIKVITSFHNVYGSSNIFKKIYNSYLTKGDILISNSEFIKAHLKTKYKIDYNRINVVLRGIDTDYFDPSKTNKNNQKYINIFQPSRISSWKGHTLLIGYFSKLIKSLNKDTKLTMISNHKSRYELELDELVKNLKLTDKINFIKPTSNILVNYAEADIVINCSLRPEGFGRTVSESLSMRIPVIAPNYGGTKEQLDNFNNKLLYQINSYSSFKKSFEYAINNKDVISSKSREFVINNYSNNAMCSTLLSLYEDCLK